MTKMNNVIPFRGIGLYIEELTAFAGFHLGGKLCFYSDPSIPQWWVTVEADDDIMASASADTMNNAVLDLYQKLRSKSRPKPDMG